LAQAELRKRRRGTDKRRPDGEIQAVGGVNEKIEGFFDVCYAHGLTGSQGVGIPRSNGRNLVLREDVIEAVREGHFRVWAIDSVDEGIELLAGMPAGELDREGTNHHHLDQRLLETLEILQAHPGPGAPIRVHVPSGATPEASPPPLPGEGNRRPGPRGAASLIS
jgi:hypothetical protein